MLEEEKEVEKENLYDHVEIKSPYDPRNIHIETRTLTISNLVDRLRNNEIVLDPDYQRNPNLWSDKEQSRLIESLLIKIPLPAFYFDQASDEKFEVVDGVQRLTAIRRFIVEKEDSKEKLRLCDLEYLEDYNGKTFEELPKNFQRRINEANIYAYVIRNGTDKQIKLNIFKRINTGGLALTSAEIRNAIYRGKATKFIKELAESKQFTTVTRGRVKPFRMLDREFVNRFFAFYLLDINNYGGVFETFLCEALDVLNKKDDEELAAYEKVFLDTMEFCYQIFGNKAFRKYSDKGTFGVINKPLFDCTSVSFARLNEYDKKMLLANKDKFIAGYINLLQDEHFKDIISNGTATKQNITARYDYIKNLIEDTLQ